MGIKLLVKNDSDACHGKKGKLWETGISQQNFLFLTLFSCGGDVQIGLDGVRMLDPSTSVMLRIYPLETIERWEVRNLSSLLCCISSSTSGLLVPFFFYLDEESLSLMDWGTTQCEVFCLDPRMEYWAVQQILLIRPVAFCVGDAGNRAFSVHILGQECSRHWAAHHPP